MCTQTSNSEPRNINVLLALETYQGMTDAEIEMVLDYRVKRALSSQELIAKTIAGIERMEQCIADNRVAAERAANVIESIVTRELTVLPIVQPNDFEPRNVEV